jgi:RND family efflux transporter MFP subunit
MKATKILLPVGVVALGLGIAVAMFVLKPRADRQKPPRPLPAVEVVKLEADEGARTVRVSGTVTAAQSAALSPEVSGRVTFVSPALQRGGRVKKGDVLFRVDSRDYAIGVEQAKAQLAQARMNLKLEESRSDVASREWKLLGKKERESDLALRKPQLANAQAQFAGAEAGLKRAEINLARATVRAPWDAIVQSENVEVGMLAAPGAQLVNLVGTGEVWVNAQVPLASARSLTYADGSDAPSRATVRYRAGGEVDDTYEATAVRLLGEVDRETRSAQVLLSVMKPFDAEGLPLLPGAFVEVEIDGAPLAGAVRVPRKAVSSGDRVFIVDKDGKLQGRTLRVVWRDRASVWSREGVVSGERALMTPLPFATDGLKVRVLDEEAK